MNAASSSLSPAFWNRAPTSASSRRASTLRYISSGILAPLGAGPLASTAYCSHFATASLPRLHLSLDAPWRSDYTRVRQHKTRPLHLYGEDNDGRYGNSHGHRIRPPLADLAQRAARHRRPDRRRPRRRLRPRAEWDRDRQRPAGLRLIVELRATPGPARRGTATRRTSTPSTSSTRGSTRPPTKGWLGIPATTGRWRRTSPAGTLGDVIYAHTSNLKYQEYAVKSVTIPLDQYAAKDKNFKLDAWPTNAQGR